MAKRKVMRTPEEIFCKVCSEKRGVNPETLKHTVILAVEIAREGGKAEKSVLCLWSGTPTRS